MTKLTFLEASNGSRLGKTFTPTSVNAYPLVKEFNSHEYEPASITERFNLIQEHAEKGHCLLRGDLKKILVNESRRGQSNKADPIDTVMLDIDGFNVEGFNFPAGKLRATHVENICEHIIQLLPPWFGTASYIGHASSSMGRSKTTRVSVHIEFMLERPINPRLLKDYISYLNISTDAFKEQLRLANTHTSIKMIIDPSVASNAHLVYIAPPEFKGGEENPFTNNDSRFCLVEKANEKLDLTGHIIADDVASFSNQYNKHLDKLRKVQGLALYRPKTKSYPTKEGKQSVVVNPDRISLVLCHIDEEFARFNGTSKDNHMYWCRLTSPHIVHCWNGDDSFEFPKADPEGYEEFMETYADNIERVQNTVAFVFRDAITDAHYTAVLDRDEDQFIPGPTGTPYIYKAEKSNLEAFLVERGQPMPEPIPSYYYVYDPHETRAAGLNLDGFVNRYSAPKHVKDVKNIPPEFKNVKYDPDSFENKAGALLKQLCPNSYKIMWHMSGGTQREFEHFLNWLAAAIGEKRPLQTVWIFSGVQGTGKGAFFNYILTPLIGMDNVENKGFKDLEDNFNSFLANKLFVAVDEFHISDSRQDQKVFDYLKNITGNDRVNVRGMYKEGANMATYCNYMFFSNHADVARLEEGDRRFNVGFPQQQKLLQAMPEFGMDMESFVRGEIADLYSFLYHYDYNLHAARTCLDNEAKQAMRVAAMSSHQKFCFALRSGDLDYFVESMNAVSNVASHFINLKQTAIKVVDQWIKDSVDGIVSDITITEALAVYMTLNPDSNTTSQKFSTMLTRNDVHKVRKRKGPGSKRQEYVESLFHFTEYEASDFLSEDYKSTKQEKVTCLPPNVQDVLPKHLH